MEQSNGFPAKLQNWGLGRNENASEEGARTRMHGFSSYRNGFEGEVQLRVNGRLKDIVT